MKYNRTFNFSAGPAMMPEPVLEEIRDEMMNYRGSGMCVMEMSHRSKVFQQIIDEAEADLRDLMNIPDNYKVLFIQGGATLQFAAIPMEPDEERQGRTMSRPVPGLRRPLPRPRSTARSSSPPPPRIRTTATFPIAPTWTSPRIPTMSISARMRPSTASPGISCPTPRAMSWCPTSPPCSSPSPATSPTTA